MTFAVTGYTREEVRALVAPLVGVTAEEIPEMDVVIAVHVHGETDTTRFAAVLAEDDNQTRQSDPCRLLVVESILLDAVSSNANQIHDQIHELKGEDHE